MIAKPRKTPLYILKLQALLRRLPPNHPKFPQVAEDLAKRMAGFKGELAADYQLTLFGRKDWVMLADLRLPHGSTHFQLDTVLLTPAFALILEVKNIAGTLYFDPEFNQLIRKKDGLETAFPDPILQSHRLEFQFAEWLERNRFPALPIHSLIVVSSHRSMIEAPPAHIKSLSRKIVRAEKLPFELKQLETQHKKVYLTEKEVKKLARSLNKSHMEADTRITDKFSIPQTDLITGVFCPNCSCHLQRYKGGWLCGSCREKNNLAHVEALKDYRLLIGSTITNKEIRGFLNLESTSAASKLLHSLNLKSSGQKKGRIYGLELHEPLSDKPSAENSIQSLN
ncbi:nuclease-related domain-containing protein [Metabacillus sp. 84]|uniref:nuclease-related domain-containing protein n=1 Tax=unclassified Metabacillus TaxID=2675274 RepID=UPI003CFADCF9